MRLSGRQIAAVDAAKLRTALVRQLWHWWCSVAGAGRPHRRDFDIVQHPGLAPNLYLIEAMPGGFRIRLTGDAFVQMFHTGKGYEWRYDSPEPLNAAFANVFAYILEQGVPHHSLGRLQWDAIDWFHFESLVCPLRNDGPDQLLGVAVRVEG